MPASFAGDRQPPRLGVVTAASKDERILAPIGHHLRWFVPKKYGLPASGFGIWRLSTNNWNAAVTGATKTADLTGATGWQPEHNWSGREIHHRVHNDATIVTRSDVTLKPGRGGLAIARAGSGDNLLIHFATPVIRIELTLRGRSRQQSGRGRNTRASPKRDVQAWHQGAVIGNWPLGASVVIEHPAITDVLVPMTIEAISAINFVTETAAAEAAERDGQLLTQIDLATNAAEAHGLVQVQNGIRHRFFEGSTQAELVKQYPTPQVRELVKSAEATIGNPSHTVESRGAEGMTPSPVKVLDHLLLAAIDPTIARMLASYWVDPEPVAGLYMVRADYADDKKTVAHGFAFSRDASPLPKLARVSATQLPGITFVARKPVGRVGLSWPNPPDALRRRTAVSVVDVSRAAGRRTAKLTDRPRLVGRDAVPRFTDEQVGAPSEVRYEVTPIDVFGRSGPATMSDATRVEDFGRPVPPKLVRAALTQHGVPWSNPALRSPADRTGRVRASAELGEGQMIAAPDAAKIHWGYRAGDGAATNRDPAAWTELQTSTVSWPETVEVQWPDGALLATHSFEVADVRITNVAAQRDALSRLGPLSGDVADTTEPGPATAEILLHTAVLEPNVFAGYTIGKNQTPVLDSTAGVGFDDDKTDEKTMTARLFVPAEAAATKIIVDKIVTLAYPHGAQWRPGTEAPPPVIAVPLPQASAQQGRAEGGEVAIEVAVRTKGGSGTPTFHIVDHGAGEPLVVVGRVVVDHVVNDERSVVLRLPPDGAHRLLQIERDTKAVSAKARHHRPYVMKQATLGLDGAGGTIELDLVPAQRFESVAISAWTSDRGDLVSQQTATPAELRVVRPPVDVRPDVAYPASSPAAERGELSAPDRNGEATARIAWSESSGGRVGVRYELGRALDSTILASETARWQRGGDIAAAQAIGAHVGVAVELTTRAGFSDLLNGTVSVTMAKPNQATAAVVREIKRGRVALVHRIDGQERTIHHRFVRASELDDGKIELVMRPFIAIGAFGQIRSNKTCDVEELPDYSTIAGDAELLRALADLRDPTGGGDTNEQAFGLVTGVPTVDLDFVDRLPGIGRSRFFYKVRAVFPGDVRSEWSPASVAFHQLNSAPADPVTEIALVDAGDVRVISFALPDDPDVIGVRVRNLTSGSEHDHLLDPASASALQPARLGIRGNMVDLRPVLGENPAGQIDVFPCAAGHSNPGAPRQAGPPIRGIVALDGSLPDGHGISVRVTDQGAAWFGHVPGRHEVEIDGAGEWTLTTLKIITIRQGLVSRHSDAITVANDEGTADEVN